MPTEDALRMIDEFAAGDRTPAFLNANRKTVADQMRVRVNDPFSINQGGAGICGPASVVFDLLRRDPVLYVAAVKQLFEIGGTTIRSWQLKPGKYLLTGPIPPDVPQADWIILASIRDSENWFYQYTSAAKNDIDASGSQLKELMDWYKLAGYRNIEEDATFDLNHWFVNRNDRAKIMKASLELFKKDYQVTWAIDAGMMSRSIPNDIKCNHVVVLTHDFTPPASYEDQISIEVFSWGRKTTIPESGTLQYGQIVDQFFGYVAAK